MQINFNVEMIALEKTSSANALVVVLVHRSYPPAGYGTQCERKRREGSGSIGSAKALPNIRTAVNWTWNYSFSAD